MTNLLRLALFGFLTSALLVTASTVAEMTIEEEAQPPNGPLVRDDIKYSRFIPRTPQEEAQVFLGGSYDYSGVGRQSDGATTARWGTLISASFFVTADHFSPQIGSHLVFYHGNSTTSSEEIMVSGGWPLYDTGIYNSAAQKDRDGALGRLDEPASNFVAVYPIYFGEDDSDFLVEVRMFGITGTSLINPAAQKIGWQFVLQTGTIGQPAPLADLDNVLFYYYAPALSPEFFSNSQSLPRFGDSGAPTFAWPPIGLIGPSLIGTHWTGQTGSAGNPVQPDLWPITDSWLGAYKSEIELRMEVEQAGIPEHRRERVTFWTGIWGDLNGNFELDSDDLDIILRDINLRLVDPMPVPRGYNWSMDFTFDGTVDAADASQLIIAIFLTRPGDINLDYQVDDDDFAILANNFGTGNEWTEGDLNGDGTVDLEDFVILDDNYPWP